MRAALVAAVALFAPAASAGEPSLEHEGLILVSDTGFASNTLGPCDPSSPWNGVDGHWFSVAGFSGLPFVLSVEPRLDGFIEFYDADCAHTGGHNARGPGGAESGRVPEGSAWTIVSGYVGTPTGVGRFVLSLG